MALSLGTLFVKLNADPSSLSKGLAEAGDKIAKFGNKLNEIGGKLGGLGLSLTAIGAAALRTAGQFDGQVKAATDGLGNAFSAVSVEIGRALIPVVQALTQGITILANWLGSLSPETKEFAAGLAAAAAGGLTLFGAISKVISVVTSLAPVFTGALAPIMPVLLPVIAVIAAIIAIVPLLWTAWKNNFGNIQGYTGAVVDWISEKWKAFKDYFKGVIDFFGRAWDKLSSFLWESWARVMKMIGSAAARVAKVFGQDWSNELDAFNETIDDMASRGFKGLVDDATEGAKVVAFAWKEGVKDIGDAIWEKIGGAFDRVNKTYGKPIVPTPLLGAGQPAKTSGKTAETMKLDEIEVVGRMGKKVEENAQATQSMSDYITGQVMQTLGDFGTLFQVIQRGLEAGGIIGAIVGALIYLVGRSKAFGELVKQISAVIDVVSEELGTILAPLFMGLAILLKALVPVISGLLKWIGAPLFYAFKLFGTAIGGLAYVIAVTWNAIVDVTAYIFEVLGHALNAIFKGLGDANIATANYIRAQKANTQEMYQMLQEFEKMDFFTRNTGAEEPSPIDPFNDSIKNVTNSLNELNESLTNVPAGFKVAAARFNATQANGPFSLTMPSIAVQVLLDGRQIYSTVKQQENAVKFIRFNRFSSNPPYIDWSQFLP